MVVLGREMRRRFLIGPSSFTFPMAAVLIEVTSGARDMQTVGKMERRRTFERETERERDREIDRDRERQKEIKRDTERQRDRETERQRQAKRQSHGFGKPLEATALINHCFIALSNLISSYIFDGNGMASND